MTHPDVDPEKALDELDEALLFVRRLFERPAYKRRQLRELGGRIDVGTFRTLYALHRLSGTAPGVSDLADRLGVDSSTASRLIDPGVAAGYISRTPSEQDRRRTELALTADGEELLEKASEMRRGLLADVTGGWSPDELAELARLLRKLRDDLEDHEL